MADMGFKQISIEPVVGKEGDFLLTEGDVQVVYDQYEKIAQEYLRRKSSGKNPFRFYHFNVNIYHGPCIYKRLSACGAGREYLAVTPCGDIYPCHQFVGLGEFIMGNVNMKHSNEQPEPQKSAKKQHLNKPLNTNFLEVSEEKYAPLKLNRLFIDDFVT